MPYEYDECKCKVCGTQMESIGGEESFHLPIDIINLGDLDTLWCPECGSLLNIQYEENIEDGNWTFPKRVDNANKPK